MHGSSRCIQVIWKCGSFSLAITRISHPCLDTDIRALSIRSRTIARTQRVTNTLSFPLCFFTLMVFFPFVFFHLLLFFFFHLLFLFFSFCFFVPFFPFFSPIVSLSLFFTFCFFTLLFFSPFCFFPFCFFPFCFFLSLFFFFCPLCFFVSLLFCFSPLFCFVFLPFVLFFSPLLFCFSPFCFVFLPSFCFVFLHSFCFVFLPLFVLFFSPLFVLFSPPSFCFVFLPSFCFVFLPSFCFVVLTSFCFVFLTSFCFVFLTSFVLFFSPLLFCFSQGGDRCELGREVEGRRSTSIYFTWTRDCCGCSSFERKAWLTHQDQGSSGHRRVCLTTKVVARHGATPGCSGCVGLGPRTEACRVRLEKALADERADPVGTPVGPISEPTSESHEPAPAAQQEPASSSSRPAAPMPTQNLQIRTSRWIYQWNWDHKNAENAKERGQSRRQQVKSLEDQW